ncbi:MAG: hypothetical protein RLN88_15240 [Ekhidna sp.]|uniref:hypothetical protein n=1 Tax=Ekhidna sp. TaxID=2608089 RepID=UPI0032EE93B1
MDKINVIYIAPIGYSGSTLMDRILGSYEGLQNIGEAKFFDEWVENDLKCSCTKKMSECMLWGEFIMKYPEFRMGYGKGNFKLNFLYKKPNDFLEKSAKVSENSFFLYDYLLKKTGNHTIVDSSKNLGRLALLAHSNLFNIKIIRMVRNGKDVCASMKLEKNRPSFDDQRKTKSQLFWKSAIKWRLAHRNLTELANEYKLPVLPVHLEHLINEEQLPAVSKKIGEFLDLDDSQVAMQKEIHSISGSHWRVIDSDHIVSGKSESKYSIGLVERMLFQIIAGKLNREFGYNA